MPGSARELMAKYLQRFCPRCDGYLGIVVPERKAMLPVQALNGRSLKCGYRLAWVLVRGKASTTQLTPRRSKLFNSSRREMNQICYSSVARMRRFLNRFDP
jgi:hypothetical protein